MTKYTQSCYYDESEILLITPEESQVLIISIVLQIPDLLM